METVVLDALDSLLFPVVWALSSRHRILGKGIAWGRVAPLGAVEWQVAKMPTVW